MIALLFLIPSASVEVSASSRYESPYQIESILVQEVAGLIRTAAESDEIHGIKALCRGDLTRQRIAELCRAVRASAHTLDVSHPASGTFGYSYSGTIRTIQFSRTVQIEPGRVVTSIELSGPIHSDSQRVGPAVGTATLKWVRLELEAVEDGERTDVAVSVRAVLGVQVVATSRCCIVRKIVQRRGPAIAAREVHRVASDRANGVCRQIIRTGREIAARGRSVSVIGNLADHGLRWWEWN